MALAAKKVTLLPPELIQSLQRKNQLEISTLTTMKLELDEEMEKILKSELSPDDKLHLYSETLLKMQLKSATSKVEQTDAMKMKVLERGKSVHIHEVERIPITQTTKQIVNFDSIDKIAAEFPIRLRSSAKELLSTLGGVGVGWNEKGEWIKDSKPIKKSNIINLVNYAIRVKPPDNKPIGLSEFLSSFYNPAIIDNNDKRIPNSINWEAYVQG